MSHQQASSYPFLVHMESSVKPGGQVDLRNLVKKSSEALHKKGLSFGTYETVVGDVNLLHRFAGVKDLNSIAGVEVLENAIEEGHGAAHVAGHFESYQNLIEDEVISVWRYEPELSVHAQGVEEFPKFMLYMRTHFAPGTQKEAMDLIKSSAKAFQAKGNGVSFITSSTVVGDIDVIHRLTPLKSLDAIGGIEVLEGALGEGAQEHFKQYKEIVRDEEISLLRRV